MARTITIIHMKNNMSSNSVLGIVMQPLIVVVIALVVACFIGYYSESSVMDNYEYTLLNEKIKSTGMEIDQERTNLKDATNLLNDDFTELYEALTEEDTETITSEMEWVCKGAHLGGYVITNLNGSVISSSFDDFEQDELRSVIQSTLANGKQNGCGDFIADNICEYASTVIKDNDDNDLAIGILVGPIANNPSSMMRSKEMYDIDMFVFAGEKCLNTTMEGVNPATIIPDQAAVDSCYIKHTVWMGKSEILGSKEYVAYMPFVDHSGVTKGMMMIIVNKTLHDTVINIIVIFLVSAFIGVMLLFVVLYMRIKRRLSDTIKNLVGEVSVIATGDLTQQIATPKYGEEIITLANMIKEMQNKIRDVIEPVVDASDSIVGSIQQLTSASNNMSNSANRQAASLEEISSSMEEMGANIQQNTDNSIQTNKLAEEINGMVDEMGAATNNSYEAIRNIANDVAAINELVMQTNILALNASVEAARAGEQGKGFAVVAKEVGRLADQTHDTADGINETATSSISEAENAYNHVTELLPNIATVVNLIKEITAASVEQNAGVNQVNSAIMDLNRVTQENAAGAEQIAASAQELQRMLHDVTTAIKVFKV